MQDWIASCIAKRKFATIAVGEDPEGVVAYTVGLTEFGHPEIFISGLRGEYCHMVFCNAYQAIMEGRSFKAGQIDDTVGTLPCVFKTLSQAAVEEFCCQALFYYEDKPLTPTFLQLVMPDKEGHLPWQPGYNAELMKYQRHLWVDLH